MEYEAYAKQTDDKLIEETKGGNSYAMETLINRYKNLVRKNAKTMYLIGGERDDLIQEGMIGLYKAIRDYKKEKNNNFFRFADLCISRQIYTAVKNSNTRKNQPLNNYISFDAAEQKEGSSREEATLLEQYIWASSQNPEDMLINKENKEFVEQYLKSRLSPFEMQVLKIYLEEENYAKVAEKLGKSLKTVDNALQRARKKLAGNVKELEQMAFAGIEKTSPGKGEE